MTPTEKLLQKLALTPIRQLGEYVSLQQSQSGQDFFVVEHPAARAIVARQGAHVLSYQPAGGEELLWCSQDTAFETGKAIRGGVPICWPWFGPFKPALFPDFDDKKRANHGFVRTSAWQLSSYHSTDEFCELVMSITDSDITVAEPDFKFQLSLILKIGTNLQMSLQTENKDMKPLAYTGALHSYLTAEMASLDVKGIGSRYIDSLDAAVEKQEESFQKLADMDRIYLEPASEQCIIDQHRCTCLTQSGADSSVVWNAGKLASGMADMHPGAEHEYICVEAAITQKPVILQPGESHCLEQSISAGNCEQSQKGTCC